MYTNISINIPNLVYFKISKFLIWNNSPEDKDIEKLRPISILTHRGEFFKMISGNLNAVLRIFFFLIIPILVYCYHYWYKVTNIGINIPKSGKSILFPISICQRKTCFYIYLAIQHLVASVLMVFIKVLSGCQVLCVQGK